MEDEKKPYVRPTLEELRELFFKENPTIKLRTVRELSLDENERLEEEYKKLEQLLSQKQTTTPPQERTEERKKSVMNVLLKKTYK